MFLARSSQCAVLNVEVGSAYRIGSDDAYAVIIREVNQIKTYPYCGELIVERGRKEACGNVLEHTCPIAFDIYGVSSDGKYRISNKHKIAPYSNDFVVKPTKSLRTLVIRRVVFGAMSPATVGGAVITILMLPLLPLVCHLCGFVVPSFSFAFLCLYVVIWSLIFIIALNVYMDITPYSLSFNSDKLHNVRTKSGHDIVLPIGDEIEKIHDDLGRMCGSIIIKPAIYDGDVLVKDAVLLPMIWNKKGEVESDAYIDAYNLVNCKSGRQRNGVEHTARLALNLGNYILHYLILFKRLVIASP